MNTEYKTGVKVERISTKETGIVVGYTEDIYYPILVLLDKTKELVKFNLSGYFCLNDKESDLRKIS